MNPIKISNAVSQFANSKARNNFLKAADKAVQQYNFSKLPPMTKKEIIVKDSLAHPFKLISSCVANKISSILHK